MCAVSLWYGHLELQLRMLFNLSKLLRRWPGWDCFKSFTSTALHSCSIICSLGESLQESNVPFSELSCALRHLLIAFIQDPGNFHQVFGRKPNFFNVHACLLYHASGFYSCDWAVEDFACRNRLAWASLGRGKRDGEVRSENPNGENWWAWAERLGRMEDELIDCLGRNLR